jgi:IS5 family transposase
VPDETTILNFRHLLERHDLTQALFDRMNAYLASRGLQVKDGTIVDGTIIAAPNSTKNQTEARDPEMRQNGTAGRAPREHE